MQLLQCGDFVVGQYFGYYVVDVELVGDGGSGCGIVIGDYCDFEFDCMQCVDCFGCGFMDWIGNCDYCCEVVVDGCVQWIVVLCVQVFGGGDECCDIQFQLGYVVVCVYCDVVVGYCG